MSYIAETIVNQALKVPFVATNNATGLTSFSNTWLLRDGVSVIYTTTFTEVGNGLYVATFTPTVTGNYIFFIEGKIQMAFKVVNKSLTTFMQNLEDVAIGSWTWDKTTNVLTFLRQDGTTLAGFSVQDNLANANRQRTTP